MYQERLQLPGLKLHITLNMSTHSCTGKCVLRYSPEQWNWSRGTTQNTRTRIGDHLNRFYWESNPGHPSPAPIEQTVGPLRLSEEKYWAKVSLYKYTAYHWLESNKPIKILDRINHSMITIITAIIVFDRLNKLLFISIT